MPWLGGEPSWLRAWLAAPSHPREAFGWKGRGGTAILSDPRAEQFFREFAEAAAGRGWLRTNSLELDGKLIATTTAVRSPGPDF
jgi:hypothetical protein